MIDTIGKGSANTMKYLFLQRHAKSSWENQQLSDFERPLNARGEHDLGIMGPVLKELHIAPDCIISSTAVRALTTAQGLATYLDYPLTKIEEKDALYSADLTSLAHIIRELDDQYHRVMLVGHNPYMSLVAGYLSKQAKYELPTCGIYGFCFAVEKWQAITQHSGELQFLEYPKRHQQNP